MKKEIIFAIIAGGGMGLLIAFGAWKANSILNQKTKADSSSTVSATNSPTPSNQELKVILQKPQNLSVLTETPVIVSGITSPNSWIVVSGEDGDNIVNASSSGSFTSSTDLTGGANQIVVSAFNQDGNSVKSNLTVVYSSQFQLTTSGNAIAYIGTVTDISNSTIQIKNDSGDIEQIEGKKDTSFIDTRNNQTKNIKQSDIAIGDFLIAMGYKDGNNILLSSRVIITDALVKTTRRAFFGMVTDDSGINKFVAKNPKTNEVITVTPAKGIIIMGAERSFGKISNNEKVIATGEFKDGILDARTIQVVK